MKFMTYLKRTEIMSSIMTKKVYVTIQKEDNDLFRLQEEIMIQKKEEDLCWDNTLEEGNLWYNKTPSQKIQIIVTLLPITVDVLYACFLMTTLNWVGL